MDITKLIGVNEGLGNVHHVRYPHGKLRPASSGAYAGTPIALFLGTGFRNIPDIDPDAFIAQTNKCLAYMREYCTGCRLLYKPHPAETDELARLDLAGFEVIREKNIADTYLEEHREEIRYAFSVHSIASLTAYSYGINAYLFLDQFRGVYRDTLFRWYREVCFTELPETCFISDLTKPPVENRKPLGDDRELTESLRSLLSRSNGTIWFTLQVSPLDSMIAVVRIVRGMFPGRKVGLLLYRHHRWDAMDFPAVKRLFDEVHVFPRTFYSLRPGRLLRILKLADAVKRFPVGPEDVFLCFAGYELLENCFISYYPKNLRMAFWTYRSFLVHQNTSKNPYFRNRTFRFTPATYLYNKIILPLMGLHRVVFVKPTGDDSELHTVHRYQRPMNELYDHVFYLHA